MIEEHYCVEESGIYDTREDCELELHDAADLLNELTGELCKLASKLRVQERLCAAHECELRSSLVESPRSCPVCDAIERHDDDLAKEAAVKVDVLMWNGLARIGRVVRLLNELESTCNPAVIAWLEDNEVIAKLEQAADELPDGEVIADEIWREQ